MMIVLCLSAFAGQFITQNEMLWFHIAG